jgi:hypothetical protein
MDKRGKKWSKEDEKRLLEYIEQKISIPEIAKLEYRTINSITERLKKISYDLVIKENRTIHEVATLVGLPFTTIDEYVELRFNFANKKRIQENELNIIKNQVNTLIKDIEMLKTKNKILEERINEIEVNL